MKVPTQQIGAYNGTWRSLQIDIRYFLTLNTLDTIEIDGAGVLFEMISYTIFILHCSVHYLPSTLDG